MESIFGRDQSQRVQLVLVVVAGKISGGSSAGRANGERFRPRSEIPRCGKRSIHTVFYFDDPSVPVPQGFGQRDGAHRTDSQGVDLQQQAGGRKTQSNDGYGTKPSVAGGFGGTNRRETDG